MSELKMNNGLIIPSLSYGTWLINNRKVVSCVKYALNNGYSHIDTAQAYFNEKGVGKAIKESGIDRSKIFVTTKVAAEIKNYKGAKRSIEKSLKKLDCGYIDLLLIHCPQPWSRFRGPRRYFKENIEVWKAMEEAYKSGKVKAIGVSNFDVDDLKNIIDNCEIKPMVNQILLHIGNTPMDVVKFCQENDIVVEAYSPITHGAALKNESIKLMADKYHVSVPQLCIKYTLQLDTVSIPKASKEEHILSNTKLDFTISEEDMIELLKVYEIDYGSIAFWPIYKKKRA